MSYQQEIEHLRIERVKLEESFSAQERNSSTFMTALSCVSLTCPLGSKIADLEKIIQELRGALADSQRTANQKMNTLNETIKSLDVKNKSLSVSITTFTLTSR